MSEAQWSRSCSSAVRMSECWLASIRKKVSCPAGVEVAIGDLLDPVSVQKALQGVDKLYLLNAVVPDELTQGLIAYDLAKRLKLKHIVYHSVFRVDHFKDVPHFASKLAIENALREFDVPFTSYSSELLSFRTMQR